jgi:hypothetical protein
LEKATGKKAGLLKIKIISIPTNIFMAYARKVKFKCIELLINGMITEKIFLNTPGFSKEKMRSGKECVISSLI